MPQRILSLYANNMKNFNHCFFIALFLVFNSYASYAQEAIVNADDRFAEYLPLLENKKVALLANQTAVINGKHLLDKLLEKKINVIKIFSPEHGFRGNDDAGSKVKNQIDKKTGLPIISLYGDKNKPNKTDLENVDILVYDIQDVGVRFFTFISTLSYAMEACAENGKQLIVLDRGNPNTSYIDGPVLDLKYKSFVGLHSVPIVYGMTVGEYAKMVNGEHWLPNNLQCDLKIIPIANYKHSSKVVLQIPPSPNLNTEISIMRYASLCLFEGTTVSVGRGTKKPFTMYGHPKFTEGNFYFTPKSIKNMSTKPPYKHEKCRGYNLDYDDENPNPQFTLNYIINAYRVYPDKENFFNNFFQNLVGNSLLKQQIIDGKSEHEIRESWQAEIEKFKTIRTKYLIYEE